MIYEHEFACIQHAKVAHATNDEIIMKATITGSAIVDILRRSGIEPDICTHIDQRRAAIDATIRDDAKSAKKNDTPTPEEGKN